MYCVKLLLPISTFFSLLSPVRLNSVTCMKQLFPIFSLRRLGNREKSSKVNPDQTLSFTTRLMMFGFRASQSLLFFTVPNRDTKNTSPQTRPTTHPRRRQTIRVHMKASQQSPEHVQQSSEHTQQSSEHSQQLFRRRLAWRSNQRSLLYGAVCGVMTTGRSFCV